MCGSSGSNKRDRSNKICEPTNESEAEREEELALCKVPTEHGGNDGLLRGAVYQDSGVFSVQYGILSIFLHILNLSDIGDRPDRPNAGERGISLCTETYPSRLTKHRPIQQRWVSYIIQLE